MIKPNPKPILMIDITKLDADCIGKPVRYQDHNEVPEFGTISSYSDSFIFVRFNDKTTSQGCLPEKLTFERETDKIN